MINLADMVVVFHREYPLRFMVCALRYSATPLWVVKAEVVALDVNLSATHKVVFTIKTDTYDLFCLIKVNVFQSQTLYASASFIVTGCFTGGLYVEAVLFRLRRRKGQFAEFW